MKHLLVKTSASGKTYVHFTTQSSIQAMIARGLQTYCTKSIVNGKLRYQYLVGSGCGVIDAWVKTLN